MLLLLAASLLGGCSLIGFAYNRLDWFASREAARYVDLDDEQERQFDRAVADLWAWHRQTELPHYARDLRALAERSATPLSLEEAADYAQRFVDIWFRLLRQGMPSTCAILATLSDDQVADMMAETQRDLDKYARKHVRPGEARVRAEAARRQLKQLRRWLGAYTTAQAEMVNRWAHERVHLPPGWLEYRRAWRHEFGQALAARAAPGFCDRVHELALNPAALLSAELREQSRDNQQRWAALLTELSHSLSDDQRAHLRRYLLDLADDLERLAAGG